MVKGETATRPKPTKEQVRVAQITQDDQTMNNSSQLSKIRKVMELTRCSETDADFALHDTGNDVEQAVLLLIESESTWKENKGRKTKKQESNQRDDYRRMDSSKGPGNRGKGNAYQNKGNFPPRNARDGQDFKPKDRQQSNQGPRGNGYARGNKATAAPKDNGQNDAQKFPISSSNSDFPNTEEDNAWKNGPLVFEKSASTAPPVNAVVAESFTPTVSIPTTKGEKLTFAAVAASKKPVQAVQPVVTSAASSLLHPEPQPTSTQADEISLKSDTKDTASPNTRHYNAAASDGRVSPASLVANSAPSTSFGPTAVSSLSVNKEFTDQLKNDIGLGSSPIGNAIVSQAPASSSVAVITPTSSVPQQSSMVTGHSVLDTRPSALLHDVEFVSGDHNSSITDFQFGFHSEAPQVDSLLSDRSMNKSRDAAASLSYMNTCNVEYQSNDLRLSGTAANNSMGSKPNNAVSQPSQSQPTQQQPLSQTSSGPQQQPSAQQQLNNASLQQQQQQMYATAAPFPGYGFPYLYSPVAASNMREVEQLNNYTALTAPFPYGLNAMNQLDMQLNALSMPPSMQPSVPQQSQQQHRSSVADNKFPPANANSTNGLQGANSYQSGIGGVGSQSGHQMRGQNTSDSGTGGAAGVAPPPGFSGPPFLTQPSFQSLFQLPNYSHPGQMSMPYFLQGNTSQQRQPQSQHPAQQANLHQQHQRLVDQTSYLDMKYPQHQSGGANTNNGGGNNVGGMPPSGNFGQGLGNGPQSGRNAGGGLDNGSQFYNPAAQSNKWTGNWRA